MLDCDIALEIKSLCAGKRISHKLQTLIASSIDHYKKIEEADALRKECHHVFVEEHDDEFGNRNWTTKKCKKCGEIAR